MLQFLDYMAFSVAKSNFIYFKTFYNLPNTYLLKCNRVEFPEPLSMFHKRCHHPQGIWRYILIISSKIL